MKKALSATEKYKAFSLVEVILSISLFALIISTIVGAIIYGRENTDLSGNRARAASVAEEALEAARNIRDENFSNLIDGIHGLVISDNKWSFFGSEDTIDIFKRTIEITSVDSETKELNINVAWQQNRQRQGNINLKSRLTNWNKIAAATQADFLSVNTGQAAAGGKNKKSILGVTIENLGTSDITIDKMAIAWSGGLSGNSVALITINGSAVWSGTGSSGQILDIANFTLVFGQGTYPINAIEFKKSIAGAAVSLVFTMTDGSTKTVPSFSL